MTPGRRRRLEGQIDDGAARGERRDQAAGEQDIARTVDGEVERPGTGETSWAATKADSGVERDIDRKPMHAAACLNGQRHNGGPV
jgi:hypothetical protein